ncbi:MAG: hypothetical protein ACXVLT_11690, partial [Flavisolibacter sp.]
LTAVRPKARPKIRIIFFIVHEFRDKKQESSHSSKLKNGELIHLFKAKPGFCTENDPLCVTFFRSPLGKSTFVHEMKINDHQQKICL